MHRDVIHNLYLSAIGNSSVSVLGRTHAIAPPSLHNIARAKHRHGNKEINTPARISLLRISKLDIPSPIQAYVA